MQTYKAKKIIPENRVLILDSLPFAPKDVVEIIIRVSKAEKSQTELYPLRGKVISYEDPTEPVVQDDWNMLI